MFLIILLFAFASATKDECLCAEAEMEAVFKFMNSVEYNDAVSLPALLSPLASCECEEINRKKRKILPDPTQKPTVEVENELEEILKKPAAKVELKNLYEIPKRDPTQSNSRNKCAEGYQRRGFLCILLKRNSGF